MNSFTGIFQHRYEPTHVPPMYWLNLPPPSPNLKSPPCSQHLWKILLLKDLVIKTNNKKAYLIYKLLKYYLILCYLISKICDTSFKNDLIEGNTREQLYEKLSSCILLPNVSLFLPHAQIKKTVIFIESFVAWFFCKTLGADLEK